MPGRKVSRDQSRLAMTGKAWGAAQEPDRINAVQERRRVVFLGPKKKAGGEPAEGYGTPP